MRLNILLIVILMRLTSTAFADDSVPPAPAGVKMTGTNLLKQVGQCQGLERYATNLSDIGITERQLQKPLSCIWGDFDGNGFLDFVIWGTLTEHPGFVGIRKFKVLLFNAGRIIKSQIIENENKDTLLLYPKTRKTGEFGEPPTKLDGLVQWGEGGPTYIYLYDQRSSKMQRHEFPSEHL